VAQSGERWYETAFEAEYLALYAHRDDAEAREQVDALLAWGFAGELIDLGCGAGRHLAALHARGVRAVGVDRSLAMLNAAPRALRSGLVRADLRRLPFADASFDGALSLFSSFGYFGPEGDRAALAEAARVLRPGGRLCLDLADPEAVRSGLVRESRRRVGALELTESRSLAEGDRLVVKRVTATERSGRVREWQERLWLHSDADLRAWTEAAGLELLDRRAAWDAADESAPARRRVWTLRRR
jgi:SAM-dependent methyltransferase